MFSYRRALPRTKAIAICVEDAREAYEQRTKHGGFGVQPPIFVENSDDRGGVTISEIHVYGDVILRFVSFSGGALDEEAGREAGVRAAGQEGKTPFSGAFLPNFRDVNVSGAVAAQEDFGLQRADYIAD